MRKVDGRKLQFIMMVEQRTAVFENLLLLNTDTRDYSVMPSCRDIICSLTKLKCSSVLL